MPGFFLKFWPPPLQLPLQSLSACTVPGQCPELVPCDGSRDGLTQNHHPRAEGLVSPLQWLPGHFLSVAQNSPLVKTMIWGDEARSPLCSSWTEKEQRGDPMILWGLSLRHAASHSDAIIGVGHHTGQLVAASGVDCRVLHLGSPRAKTGSPWWLSGEEPACQCRRHWRCGFHPWVRKSHWRRNGYPLQYASLGDPVDRGAWRSTVHGVTKSWTWHSD